MPASALPGTMGGISPAQSPDLNSIDLLDNLLELPVNFWKGTCKNCATCPEKVLAPRPHSYLGLKANTAIRGAQ